MRSKHDCVNLSAMISEMNDIQLALLFGILCHTYLEAPDAEYWNVLQKFSEKRVESMLVGKGL
jgi:hypothetical protein